MGNREIRIPITNLKDYLNEVGITVTALAELSGVNRLHLHKCMMGEVDDRNGAVRKMSDENLARVQAGLHQLSLQLKYRFIFYNSDQEVVKHNGGRYCPGCVEQIKEQLSPYMNILPFMQHSLGWSRSKIRNVINIKKSASYGNICRNDVDRINVTLAEVATRLDVFTLIK